MLFDNGENVYVFCFDSIVDTSSIADYCFSTLDEAEEYCADNYSTINENWVYIANPQAGCQDDCILPTRVKNRESGNPQSGNFEVYIKGKWLDKYPVYKEASFSGMTVMERLYESGLITEFDNAKKKDKQKAIKILEVLQVDKPSILKIV